MDCYKKNYFIIIFCISDSLIMTRGCLPTALDNDCQRSSAGVASTVLCYCNSDRCNGASSGPSVFIVVFFAAMIAR